MHRPSVAYGLDPSASSVILCAATTGDGGTLPEALTTAALAFGLAMDAFAVAVGVAVSLGRPDPRQVFRLSFHFGLFQFLMPIVGWFSAGAASRYIEAYDHWVAFVLLAAIGGRMVAQAVRAERHEFRSDPTRGASLVVLSVATSIDALAVGLSMRILNIGLWVPCVAIGLSACAMTVLGMAIGARLPTFRTGAWAEAAGGIVLVLIGAKVLISHLAA